MSAFGIAMDVLFADPNLARDAVWRADGTGPPVAVRIMLRQPDRVGSFGETRLLAETAVLDIRLADAPALASGDVFEIGGETFMVQGEPVRDSERLVWTAELRPA